VAGSSARAKASAIVSPCSAISSSSRRFSIRRQAHNAMSCNQRGGVAESQLPSSLYHHTPRKAHA
jgi:hypothetical protein